MDPIRFAIENPVKVAVGVILIVLFGLIALTTVPVQLTPDIDRPMVTVRTTWPGRSPEEVEETILIEQESKLKTIQGLYKMTSRASLGRADITLEFNVGYDMSRALQEVSNKLDEVPTYPDDVDRPVIRASDTASDDAIAYALLRATKDPNYDIARFYDYADRYLKPTLERIEGVSEITIYGGRVHQVQVRVDPAAMAQRGITADELRNALRGDNVNESAGDLADGRLDMRFRVLGQYDSLEPVRQTVLKYDAAAAPIRVEDIAEVTLSLEKKVYFNQNKGQPSMTVLIRREVGANILDIMDEARRRIDEMNAPGGVLRLFQNDRYGLRLRLVIDDTYYIRKALALVRENLVLGGCLAIAVLLIFLRSIRPTLIIAVAIPISVIGTFAVMAITGRNINVISLAGLSFAVGMVVDNAIVVLENIDRHLKMGEAPGVAAYRGAKEVWGAILASTLTTVAVFGPVLTIQEEAGQLFYDIALAICAAVLLSLLVSITVIPAAGTRFLRHHRKAEGRILRAVHSFFGLNRAGEAVVDAYARFIHLLAHRSLAGAWARTVIIVTVIGAAFGLSWWLMPPASYLPDGKKNVSFGRLFTPPGYSFQQNYLIGQRLEETIGPYWEAENSEQATALGPVIDPQTKEPIQVVPAIDEFFFVVTRGYMFIIATSKDPDNVRPIASIMSKAMSSIPAAYGVAQQRSLFGRNAGGSNSVEVEVVGNDMNRVRLAATALETKLMDRFSKFAVRAQPMNYNEAGPERRIVVDQVRAKELGLSTSGIAVAARAMIDGALVGDFNFNGDNIDMIIIRNPDIEVLPAEFPDIPIAVSDSNGETVVIPLGEVVDFIPANASQEILRIEEERGVQFTVNPPANMALEDAERIIGSLVADCRAEGNMPIDIMVNMAGNADKLSQTRRAMLGRWTGWNWESLLSVGLGRFFLALLITYLLMAALFESFLYPLVILFSVPMATVGGFIGLALVHYADPTQQMDVLTMLGFIILIGVVVNNAILIVHQALNFMRGRGEAEEGMTEPLPPREAIRESVRTRMRPIFMTTATSVCGMLPLVLAPGAGSELYRGLGAVVVGGLICSMFFTLLVVPLLFSLVLDARTTLLAALRGGPPPASSVSTAAQTD